MGWVCEEATKDTVSGGALLGLLSEEKERLRKVLIEDSERLSKAKPSDFWSSNYTQKATENTGPILKNCVGSMQYSIQPKAGSVSCEQHLRQCTEQGSVDYSLIHESSPVSTGPTSKRNCVGPILKHVQGVCLQYEEGGGLMTSDAASPFTNLNRLSALVIIQESCLPPILADIFCDVCWFYFRLQGHL